MTKAQMQQNRKPPADEDPATTAVLSVDNVCGLALATTKTSVGEFVAM
jgi:hypothetical protein